MDENAGPQMIYNDPQRAVLFADMTGDGLSDVVMVSNGRVCYWPNQGYGRFGRKVTMTGSPWFEHPDQFHTRWLRVVDVDGTGPADLVYFDGEGARVWFNEAGNGFSEPVRLSQFPAPHTMAHMEVADLLGRGTACLLWSSPLPTERGMRYVDLFPGGKPYLLDRVDNGMGLERRVHYGSSTEHYLRDRAAGKPWATRLPFPVQVIDRVEVIDHARGHRMVSTYAYHHGYFDAPEREFRGFGMVEQRDTERFEHFGETASFPTGWEVADEGLHAPPVVTKTWFHTGAYLARGDLMRQYEKEYWQGDENAPGPLVTKLPKGMRGDERREALRALRGRPLRQEVYAEDGTELAPNPYQVTEHAYALRMDQAKFPKNAKKLEEGRNFGVFFVQVLHSHSVDAGERWMLADVAGAPLRLFDGLGRSHRFRYDVLRRPTQQWVQPEGGNETLVVLNVWGETADSPEDENLRGQLIRQYDGAGLLENTRFHFAGHLLEQSRTLTVGYAEVPDWSALASATTLGDLDTAHDGLIEDDPHTTQTTHDALGRPVQRTTPDGSVTRYAYSVGGLLASVQAEVRGATTATTFVDDIEYDVYGRRASVVHGNGTTTEYEYDPRSFRVRRILTTRSSGPSPVQDLRYTYDPVGNVVELRDHAQQTVYFANSEVDPHQRFEYDALYRLVRAEGREHVSQGQPTESELTPGPQPAPSDPEALREYVEEYTYDEVGNLEEVRHVANGGSWTRTYTYATNGNRLLQTSSSQGPLSYSYDAHGNMTAMPHLSAVDWDHADRMQHAERDGGGSGDVYFQYDAEGNRVRKVWVNQHGTAANERIYLGGVELYRERDVDEGALSDIELERETLHIADDTGRIVMVETRTVAGGVEVTSPANVSRYQYGNHLGSVSLELDDAANVISYEEFHPFGTSAYRAVDSTIEVSPKRYRYAAAERDEETGLDHMGLRYYAPWLGRWTSADPIGLGDGVNRYAYVHGNPVSMRDPGGTKTEKVDPAKPPVRQAGESESAYLQRFKEFQQSAEVQEALKQDAAAQPKAKAKAKAEPEPSDIGRGGEGEGAGGVAAPAEEPGDVPGTPEGGEGDDAGSWLADAFTGFLAAVGVTSGDKVNFEADSTNLGVPGGSGTGDGARWKQLVYLVREALTTALLGGVAARAKGAIGWVAERLGRAADQAKQVLSRVMRRSDDTGRKAAKGGGPRASKLEITRDEFSVKGSLPDDPKTFVRVEPGKDTFTVTDIFRGGQPKGTGGNLMAQVLDEAGFSAGKTLRLGPIENAPTQAVFKAGGDPASSVLGRTAANALSDLGISPTGFRFEVIRGKLNLFITTK